MMLSSETGSPKNPPPVEVITTYLMAVLPEIRARRRFGRAAQFFGPHFLARLRIKRAEPRIVGRADENEAAGCHDRPPLPGRPVLCLSGGGHR